ncbi:MAG: hypothetical protein ACRDQ9_12565 [Pseudonocardiaceae bacterium]
MHRPVQHSCAEQDAPLAERRGGLHEGMCPQTGVARPPDAGQKTAGFAGRGWCEDLVHRGEVLGEGREVGVGARIDVARPLDVVVIVDVREIRSDGY